MKVYLVEGHESYEAPAFYGVYLTPEEAAEVKDTVQPETSLLVDVYEVEVGARPPLIPMLNCYGEEYTLLREVPMRPVKENE